LAAKIKDKYNVEVEMIQSHGGVFEVKKDGELIFSKKATGRFPEDGEVFSKFDAS